MDFLRNVTREVGKKSGQLVEQTKLASKINAEENKMEKLFVQLGEKVYEAFRDGEEFGEDYNVIFSDLNMINMSLEELRAEMLEVKGVHICPNCGAEVEKDSQFCTKCGTKMAAEEEAAPEVACVQCGTQIPEGTVFCPECGAKQE